MADFREKGLPSPEFRTEIFQSLQDTYAFGQKTVVKNSNIVTTLHYMVGDAATAVSHL